ncbi:MXAN_6577-like cysteine-rich protein [Myxococcus sp. AB025B]|uniref:MXAN_6577-like cysteine-rich protein n=1 Tax=Myxococcus sp. AB025B TaxID=2562794 RepID=UPI001141EAC3|nr:MXAN_6577-like cysteine-rich protein [Myxococcus sp. AB025B]
MKPSPPPGRHLALLCSLLSCLLLTGCPDEGVVCSEGLSRCGDTCADLTSESANCGACGNACGEGQLCAEGACRCLTGTTACDGACVDTRSSPQHCGACGTTCDSSEVCEQGTCQLNCTAGLLRCGNACVDGDSSNLNCGACGNVCGDARTCRGGVCTYDIVATCFNTGQVVGIQSGVDLKGPGTLVASSPQSAARMSDVLLVLDSTRKLIQARLDDYGVLPPRYDTGRAPNQVLVEGPFIYILNSTDNTLQVLRSTEPLPPGKRHPEGISLQNVASVSFGANTNPFGMARVGNELWVTLYGNLVGDPSAGGRVARVSLASPSEPRVTATIDLPTGAALRPFPDNTTLSTPAGITQHRGKVYVALNNLNPATYAPGGPGLLARIEPATGAVSLVGLGDDCLNPNAVASVGEHLVVSCGGRSTYDAEFKLVSVERTGLVMLDAQDTVVASEPIACSPGIGSCPIPAAGRFAVVGPRIYTGDTNGGRVFVHEIVGNTLVERRGLKDTSEPAIAACPASGFSLVSDVVALP